jgi:predicted phosphodiesterase
MSASPTPAGALQTEEGDIPSQTEGDPIHMPDLIGRSLDYATSIWDSDEPLPQIRVERLSNGANLVVVRQQPAPGTLIVPSQATIVLTLGQGPVLRPKPSPTPRPLQSSVAAVAGQATLLRAPYVQNVKTTSVTIVWTTVENGASEVDYGISDYSLTTPATSTFFTTPAAAPYNQYYVHEATLSGLTTDTVYQYKIFTNSADLTPGGSVTFRTAKPLTTNSFRFAIFGDSGDGSQNQKDVATRLLQVQPDLVLHAGDIIYAEASYNLFETRYFQIYKDLLKSVWLAPAMGNHDVTYNNGQSFVDVFVNPPNATNPAERELYYSFDYGNAHYLVLNNYFSMTTVGSAQYNWLKNDLATSNQFWKFVVFHEPAYASTSSQLPRDNAAIVKNLVPLFEQYNVDIVFSGHWHYYERMYPLLGGQVSTINAGGIVYIVTGGGGAGLHAIGTGTLNSRTAAKVRKFHLTMVDIQGCSLQLSAVQKVSGTSDTFDPSDVFDTYTINRCGGSTATPTMTPTNTPTRTPSSTATFTKTATSVATATPTYTPTNTLTPTRTATLGPTPTNTPTPTPTFTTTNTLTPTNTNTPGPTFTPTPTFTPSPTSAVSDLIFANGFESGNFSAWSSATTGGGDLSVSSPAALVGSKGMQVLINDTTSLYVTDLTPNAEPRYRARFYFDPNSITMTDGNSHYIFMGLAPDTSSVFQIDFRFSGGNYQIRVRQKDDSGLQTTTAWVTIGDAPHVIEMEWWAASVAGANNGGINLWIDGFPSGSLSNLDNDTERIDSVRLGAVTGIKAGTLGTYYIDAFESRRETYIGP